MTDEIMPQNTAKKDDKKPNSGNNRGSKKNAQGGPRPSSRTSNKKPSNPPTTATESGSETASRKGSEKKTDHRNKNQGGGGSGRSNVRKTHSSGAQAGRQGNNSKDKAPIKQASSSPGPNTEASAALSSLQRVIADLKTTSPIQPPIAAPAPQLHASNLPPNAPVFQPGAAAYPSSNQTDPKHRKAASLGPSTSLSSNFNSFSPHLGAMIEDVEDGTGNVLVEDGEIQEMYYYQAGHQPRSQSQSFMAPRFAALAQQDQGDAVGPSGRPQLAPGFMFGARRRGNSGVPMGPPINEEDMGFQFPQQQQQAFQPEPVALEPTHRKSDSGEITGIMAEQVQHLSSCTRALLTSGNPDCFTKSDRSIAATAAGPIPTTTRL